MDSLSNELSNRTAVFGLKLWEVVGLAIAACIVLSLLFISLWLRSKRRKKGTERSHLRIPNVSKEITVDLARKAGRSLHPPSAVPEEKTALKEELVVFVHGDDANKEENNFDKADREYEGWRRIRPRPAAGRDVEMANRADARSLEKAIPEGNKRGQHPCLDKGSSASGHSSDALSSPAKGITVPQVSHLGWGHWYTLRELEMATDSFADSKVLGEGGYGIVYLGHLPDGTRIAVKNLLNNRGQAEREFKVEVEAIGRVRHKNLVRLIGYCMEGSQRMLVYEYVDSGNLAQWLHGPLGEKPPMSWDIRMKIILGTAKGLSYLHEGLEPKVVHRDVKSSNILIDSQWNAKVSDFGLAKLLGAENSHVTTRVMGTFGYVAPEYAQTGMLTEKSDVYSYGVLVMELVTGRVPVDYGRPSGEVNLVDWLKTMIGNRLFDEVADPKMEPKPSPRALKRALLVALRCVDPDSQKRPKMGHIVHMLEAEDSPFRDSAVRSKNTPLNDMQTNGHTPTMNGRDRRDMEPSDVAKSRARWRYES